MYRRAYALYTAASTRPASIGEALSAAIQKPYTWDRLRNAPIDRIVDAAAQLDLAGLRQLGRDLPPRDEFGRALIQRASVEVVRDPDLCIGHPEDLAMRLLTSGLESMVHSQFLDVAVMKHDAPSSSYDPGEIASHHREILRHAQLPVHARQLLEQSPVAKRTRPLEPKRTLSDLLAQSADAHVRGAG